MQKVDLIFGYLFFLRLTLVVRLCIVSLYNVWDLCVVLPAGCIYTSNLCVNMLNTCVSIHVPMPYSAHDLSFISHLSHLCLSY
jgi:hypothetical protein